MLTAQSFTDPQGQSFTNAVVRVINADYNKSTRNHTHESLKINTYALGDPSAANSSQNTNESQELMITFGYWPTQADYDAGNQPYKLTNSESQNDRFEIFTDELEKTKYDGLSLEAKCELYFNDVILLNLQITP